VGSTWNARATCRSLFPSLPDLLGSKLECPGPPPWEEPNYVWLEDRLSCMWNDVWNDVKTTSRRRDFSTWQ